MKLIHARMLPQLGALFPSLATVQSRSDAPGTYGTPTTTWTVLLTNVPCAVGPTVTENIRATERVDGDKTVSLFPHRITLKGYYPQVKTTMRIVVDGVAWAITGVEHDSQRTLTRLMALEDA